MSQPFSYMSNLGHGLALNFIAYSLAIFPVTIMLVIVGGTQFETPLLLTLIAGTASTTVVTVVTTRAFSTNDELTEGNVREFASASYIFVNAAGTLAILVSHLVHTFETGRRSYVVASRDAATLVLDKLSLAPADSFTFYLVINALCAVAALLLMHWGARIIANRAIENTSRLAGVSILSVLLLVLGLFIGTSWAPVPINTGTLSSALGVAIDWTVAALLVVSIPIFAALQLFAVRQFAVLFSIGALRLGAKYSSEEYRKLSIRALKEVARGTLLGAIGAFAIWTIGFGLVWALSQFPEASGDEIERIARAVGIAILIGFQILVALLAAAFCAFILLMFAKPTLQTLSQMIVSTLTLIANLGLLLGAGAVFVYTLISKPAAQLNRKVTDVWSRRRANKKPSPETAARSALPPFESASKIVKRLRWPELDFRTLATTAIGLLLFGLAFATYATSFNRLGENTEGGTAAEVEQPEEPAPPGFEFARPQPVTLCQAIPGGLDWALSSFESFEIALEDCILPDDIRRAPDGVLIVVSVASFGNNQEREIELAMQRGIAMSEWASIRAPVDMPIYVLNLGMARSPDSFSTGWRLFGRVTGERPALSLLIRPYPEGTIVPTQAVLGELSKNVSLESVSSSFTNCELFKFEKTDGPDSQLVRVPEFTCQFP